MVAGAAGSISGKKGYASFVQPPNGTTLTADSAYDAVWRHVKLFGRLKKITD